MSSATHDTHRLCPYCGERIRLADCPIVATNYGGVFSLSEDEPALDEIELPSAAMPLRLLPKTGWPVLCEAPAVRLGEDEARNKKTSAFAQAFGGGRTRAAGPPLAAPTEEEGVAREDLPARACPRCEFPLPATIDSRPALVVAVVGVNRVGKTHLLASLLAQAYRQAGLSTIGVTEFTPEDETGERFLKEYFNPLFRDGQILALTQGTEVRFRPLVFNVTIGGAPPFSLVLHDVAGEVLGDRKRRAIEATYLRGARALIFVVDPRDIDGLRDNLPVWMLEADELGWDQGTLLSTCLRTDGVLDGKPPVPLALTVTKADILPEATGEDLPFLCQPEAGETREEFVERIRRSSEEVEHLLERYRAHHILGPIGEYRRRTPGSGAGVTFHAVSALGAAPNPDGGLSTGVAPVNCLDPLASVLLQLFHE